MSSGYKLAAALLVAQYILFHPTFVAAQQMTRMDCQNSALIYDTRLSVQRTSDSNGAGKCIFWVSLPRDTNSTDPGSRAADFLDRGIRAGDTPARESEITAHFVVELLNAARASLDNSYIKSEQSETLLRVLVENKDAVSACVLQALKNGDAKQPLPEEVGIHCEFGEKSGYFQFSAYHGSFSYDYTVGAREAL